MKSLFAATIIFGFLTLGFCQSDLSCWVGYANNNTLRGGSVPCDGGTCIYVNGSYAGQQVNLFACEPQGICSAGDHFNVSIINVYCCNDTDNCNANGFTMPPPVTPAPPLPTPIVCLEGLYINNKNVSRPSARACYGNCASVSGTLNTTTFTVTTCDPLALCDSLDLVNSCHTMPQQILSGCCCDTNLCIDPGNNVLPTPPQPPPGSIKCFIGLQMNNQTPIGSETYCPGMCHTTSATINNSNYTVFACDRYQICEMFGIRPNGCGSEEGALQSCCCNSDNCNTPTGFTPPTVDPNPPLKAERCFTGFQTTNLGPLGRSAECFGDCVTYSAGGLKIFGCDPISVCEQLNAKNTTGTFGDLSVSCCSTRDCNYQPSTTSTTCYNGITINMPEHNVSYSKAQSLPCMGRCATFSVQYKHLMVDVYTCDPYNVCQINSSDILKVNCCDTPNCNINPAVPVTTVSPMGRNISCFQGFQIRRGFAFGNEMSCDGACARVHIGDDTIYTCDPGDTCGDFGVDGCNMLFDGLTVCCCRGRMCNAPETPIRPAIKQNLNCFIGFGVGGVVSGGQLPCDGMCGKLTTSLNNATVDAYLCLDQPLCVDRDAYERCSSLQTDRAVRVCCCGGYDHCNYEPLNGTVLPPPPEDRKVACAQGLYINGAAVYHTGTTFTTCPNDCGLLNFNTTFGGSTTTFSYYGCDPASFCTQFSLANSCGSLGSSVGACCCDSDLCMNPIAGKMTPTTQGNPGSNLTCWVGYANNNNLRGGPIPCDGGTCVHVNGTYAGQQLDLFACEPMGICASSQHLTVAGLDAYCCQDSDNCNANGFTMPPPVTPAPALPNPIVCNEGIYINTTPLSTPVKKLCYGNCASVSGTLNSTTFSVATCDPLTLCDNLNLVNSCHTMPQQVISGCCCDSNLCIDPAQNIQPTPPPSPGASLSCWVGYANNNNLRGGPIPCDGGTCVHVNGTYAGQQLDLFACEPMGLCPNSGHLTVAGLDGYCCQDSDNCNANGFTMPPAVTPTPGLPNPIVCNEGIYINSSPLSKPVKKICYGNCASVTGTLGSSNFTVATCDPLTLCDNLDLVNSCHTMPQKVISGCCCDSSLCIDPAQNSFPTPPPPPSNAIKCFIGLQMNSQTPVGAETYCPGMCHSTSTTINNSNYTVYACDRYQICEMFGIRPNSCGSEEGALNSCCCDSDNCNTPAGFTPPTVDPNPPLKAERCFTGFQTSNLGPLGRSAECFGDCVTYSAGGLKIFGCDPISVCDQLNAKNRTGTFGDLSVSCCSTRDCNYQPSTTSTTCYNGITINMPEHNVSYSKAQSLPCMGRCATFSVQYKHLMVDVYTCDPYNVCQLNSSDILKVNCCDTPNCNINPAVPVTTVSPMGRNISCFQGFQIRRGFAFGNQMSCDGACARVHIGDDTIYTCDPGDTCGDFGVDGCNMLFDGLTVCCCKGNRCNEPERPIRPAIKQNLNCFIGYGVGAAVSGGQLPCNGMCGKMTTMIGNATVDAYLCLDQPLCEDRGAYERCSNLRTDMAVRVCCCGGYDHCNYEPMNSTVLPPPPTTKKVSCPQGLYINGAAVYHSGTTVTTCPNDCGLLNFTTTFMNQTTAFSYYGCDPASFCTKYSLANSCGALGDHIGGCCCDSDLCMNPIVGKMSPAPAASDLSCWVGYYTNGTLRGGSVPCSDGTCVHLNGTYNGTNVDVFACEPYGICNDSSHLTVPGMDAWCCQDSNNCNAAGYDMPEPPPPSNSTTTPILCNEGIYKNNMSLSVASQKMCYGECASVSLALGNDTLTVATCDPVTLCQNLELTNSCHVMPQQVLSGCCCNSDFCIDPVKYNGVAGGSTAAPATTPTGSANANTLSAILLLLTVSFLFF